MHSRKPGTLAKTYLILLLAVAAETIGTSALQASQQFTKPIASGVVVVAYAVAFYLLSLTLKMLPVGIMYAIWSGLGIVFIAFIGWVWFRQSLDLAAIIGISLIVAGIAVIQLFSQSAHH